MHAVLFVCKSSGLQEFWSCYFSASLRIAKLRPPFSFLSRRNEAACVITSFYFKIDVSSERAELS